MIFIKKTVMRCLIVLLAVIFTVSGYLTFRELWARSKAQKDFDSLAQQAQMQTSPAPETEAVHKRDIAALTADNADCVGWVCIPDTAINYPVMLSPDEPQRYLHRSFSGAYSVYGVPFLDGKSQSDDVNQIIFGHNMKDGSMFAGLHCYEDPAFYQDHPVIEFETVDGCREYTIFAVLQLNKNDPWYDFFTGDSDEYAAAVDALCLKALYDTGCKPSYPQKLLTLSTCGGKDRSARLVVVAAE